jgi:O-antigen ligase
VHHFRIWKFSFEDVLLAGGIVVLIGTLSRGGLASFMLVVAFLFILMNIRFVRWLSRKWNLTHKVWLTALLSLAVILIYLILLTGGLFALSKVDPRMEAVFHFDRAKENPLIDYAETLQFGERIIYWQTGWNIFNDHPIVGVGVGFSGFYFPQYLPDSGWELTETRKLLYHSPGLMNIKNLWARLLAETGVIGFALFVSFLVVTAFTAMDMMRSKFDRRRTAGYMGIFMLIALILEEFSVDSFALPYVWFTLGLVIAAWRWYYPDINVKDG